MNRLQQTLIVAGCLWLVSPITLVFAETHSPGVAAKMAAKVAGIDPASTSLPENLLRIHIRFTEPMREGLFMDYVEVIDVDSGKPIPWVFFDSFYELWNQDRTQLTVLVDPGRVKTGLAANSELGRAFIAGKQYSVNIKRGWVSISGTKIEQNYSHRFTATAQVRTRIKPENWEIEVLKTSVQIDFQRVIDIHSLNAHVVLVTAEDETIAGQWLIYNNGHSARFDYSSAKIPDRIAVRNRFEDVAGNTIVAAFDHAAGDSKANEAIREKQITIIELD